MVVLQSFAAFAALAALLPQVSAQCSGVTSRFQPKMGSGYRVSLVASGLRGPRHIAFDSAGALLVAEQQGGTLRRLTFKESGTGVCVDQNKVLVTGTTNHGVALSADGKTLFVSNLQSVTAYAYDAAAGTVGTAKTIITGMQSSTVHPTRAILTSKANPDVIFVARGSNNNIDTPTTAASAGRSIIKQFSISRAMQAPIDYTSGGEVTGFGLRNIVGMGEDPFGGIWSVENGMDDVRLGGRDIHMNNPAEKLNYHGSANDTANPLKGANYGYPSCVPAWDTASVGSNIAVGALFKPDGTPAASPDCSQRQTGRVNFPAHTAPLDVKFLPDGSAAFVSFHGSWNRQPPDGYRVMRVDFRNGQPVADATSKTAGVAVMENTNTGSCPGSCFRPVGLAVDSKNRLFVSSDSSGELYVITSS